MTFFIRKKFAWNTEEKLSSFLENGEKDFLYTEQFKALRAKFEYKVDMHNRRVVAVTSAIAGEGKTVSSIHLARNLAATGRKKVLLVDMDLRKADLARWLGISPLPGLTEFLSGSADPKEIIRSSKGDNLYIIPAGARISGPSDLVAGQTFRNFIELMKTHFEVVLLDTPPVVPVADTIHLKDHVDGFLIIFRIGYTPMAMLRQAIADLEEKHILGVVLNGVEPKSERYYARYYGKYYKKHLNEESHVPIKKSE